MADLTVAVRHTVPGADDNPGAHGVAWFAQAPAVTICRDVYGGTLTLRAKGRDYLPQFPKEDDAAYSDRLRRAVLFNAYRKTVKALTGMVFRKDPVLGDDAPPAIVTHAENIDLAGRHIAVFARDLFADKVVAGHSHILVDWHGPEGARSAAEEGEARPYWVQIAKEQVLRYRTEDRGGNTVLVSFAYIEGDVVPDGEYTEKEIERVRQYDLLGETVMYRSWTRDKDEAGEWVPEVESKPLGPRMTKIPVATDYGDRTGYMTSDPPLLDLALENLEHYDVRSDRRQSLKIGSVPIFVTQGVEASDIGTFAVGGSIGLALPQVGQDAKYVETSGNAYDASREELQDIEQRMSALGLAVLVRKDQTQRTATENSNDKLEQDSDLASMARGTSDAIEEAFGLHAMWMGEQDGGSCEINRDFNALSLSPQMVATLIAAVPDKLSVETLWEILQQGEVLPDTFDPEEEQARLQQAGAAELAAVTEALRRDRMTRNPQMEEAA